MKNELTRLRRATNPLPSEDQDIRVPVQEQRRNPTQDQRERNDRRNEEHRPRAPQVPNPNALELDEIVIEESFEDLDLESNTMQNDGLELVQTDELEPFYIFNEQDENDILQDNVIQTRAQINKVKEKEVPEKEKTKSSQVETTKQPLVANQTKTPQQMTYNIMDDLSKLKITFPFMEVIKIPQQRENLLKIFDDSDTRMEVAVINSKQQQNYSSAKPKPKVPPFYITIENHEVVLHNCLIDSGATNNIMPLSVMQALRMECTRHYETGESIYAIDSRKVPAYGEIKYFCAWISATPHITIVFTIVVVDLPPTYGVVLGRDWSSMIGGYIMNDKSV
jgi:hypothetical protein